LRNSKKLIANIDATLAAEEAARNEEIDEKEEIKKTSENSAETKAVRAFADYVRSGKIESRANNLTFGDNGAVVPETIANKIIETVKQICPVYEKSEIFHVKGTLLVPTYGLNSGEDITCAYAAEFTDLTSTSGKFTSVSLGGHLAGALTKVSKQLANSADFNIVDFIVKHMAEAIAQFLESELLNGSGTNACQGILTGATNVVTSGTIGQIKTNDLIDLQEAVIDQYQRNALWIMHPRTRTAIRKLKDSQGNYLLNPDLTAQWGYTLLGKPVYTSENMPESALESCG
jgi:HK97 family phage major capsid protein